MQSLLHACTLDVKCSQSRATALLASSGGDIMPVCHIISLPSPITLFVRLRMHVLPCSAPVRWISSAASHVLLCFWHLLVVTLCLSAIYPLFVVLRMNVLPLTRLCVGCKVLLLLASSGDVMPVYHIISLLHLSGAQNALPHALRHPYVLGWSS